MELYSDFLMLSFGQTSATVLSRLTEGKVSHDQVTRFLHQGVPFSQTIWQLAKPLQRQINCDEGVISIDDSLVHKPHSQENGTIEWYHDHTTNRQVKGINFITACYTAPCSASPSGSVSIPVAGEVIQKIPVWDDKKQKTVMRSPVTKNQHFRQMLSQCKQNNIKFKYVLSDTWYANAENMEFIVEKIKKKFVMAVKTNMTVMICEDDTICWKGTIQELDIAEGQVCKVYISGLDFPVYITKHIFKNEDGMTGILYLCTNDESLNANEALIVYQKRWPVEEFHKSLKQNVSLSRCPASSPECQIKHILASFYGYIKWEAMKVGTGINQFALRSKLYISAIKASMSELHSLRKISSPEPFRLL